MDEHERMAQRYPSHQGLASRSPAPNSQPPAADAEAARMAAKYPSHAKLPGGRAASPASPRAAADSEEARLAARYPSHAKLRELAPPDRDPALDARYPTLRELRAKETGSAASDGAEDKPAGADGAQPAADAFELPEGFDANDEAVQEFLTLAEGLDPKRRGELLGLHQRAVQAQQAAWDAQVDGWEQSLRSDREIGGAAFDESVRTASSVVREFGTPQLAEVLDGMLIGNHPEVVRLLVRVGRELKKARGGGR